MPDTDPDTATAASPKPFAEVLTEFRRGQLHAEASRALHDLIDDVVRHEKAGSLTLTVKVKHVGDMQIEMVCDLATKPPKATPPAAMFFVDRQGNPTRHDPYQSQLFDQED